MNIVSKIKSFFKGKKTQSQGLKAAVKKDAERNYGGIDPDSKRYQSDPQEKVLKEAGGQDISAI